MLGEPTRRRPVLLVPAPSIYILQRGVQWKQGVVISMVLYASLLCDTTPIHCTPDPLHPPLQSIQSSRAAPPCATPQTARDMFRFWIRLLMFIIDIFAHIVTGCIYRVLSSDAPRAGRDGAHGGAAGGAGRGRTERPRRPGQFFSIPCNGRGTVASWANRPAGAPPRPALPRRAPPRCAASPEPPVVCPGFGFERSTMTKVRRSECHRSCRSRSETFSSGEVWFPRTCYCLC